MSSDELWQRLRQRKLVQWALAYAAGAFALLQGVDMVAQRFGWPESLGRGLIIAAFVGFLVTLLVAWYHGERGAQRVSGTELLLLALLLSIGGALMWRFAPGAPAPPASAASPAAVVNADRRSIAVLPFVNMSGDKDNEYFSDGISEEILNVLARTRDLHVAARTSSFSFKGKALEVPAIARELNVRMVLEGSVRKQGERVRITAQLIDASNGYHAWSQTYDRELEDIFAIQDEIARAIGDALQVKLAATPGAAGNSTGTADLKAYDLYLRGIDLWQTRRENELWQAVDLFKQAIAADSRFAQAHGALALTYAVLPGYSARISYKEAIDSTTDAAQIALALDPSLPEPYVALAGLAGLERRQTASIALFERAIALRPSFATAYQWLGTQHLGDGDPAAAVAALGRASELDPRSPVVASTYALALLANGRNDEARTACERIAAFAPDFLDCLQRMGLIEVLSGDVEAARRYFARIAELHKPRGATLAGAVADALQGRGDRQALAQRLAAFPGRSSLDPDSENIFETDLTSVLLVRLGTPDLALDYLERRVDDPGTSQPEWTIMLPALDPIRCTPRFEALVRNLKTHDPRAASVCGKAG